MKKIIASLTVLLLLAVYSMNVDAAGIHIDTDRADDGIVGVTYLGKGSTRYKVMISKGSEQYNYDYFGPEEEYYPLQSGSGTYKISVLENISGTKYKVLKSEVVTAEIKDDTSVFLQSVQNIRWSDGMGAVSLAAGLVEGLESTEEKVEAIYRYIVSNIDYDYDKLGSLNNRYVPDVEETLESKKGICYDYSALFASMLRSQGIPTKLVKGYTDTVEGYHAWNEVFIHGEWVVIDTTFDAMMDGYGEKTSLVKNRAEYQISKVY